ncbi:MAG: 4-(cytidine 5'-diphospho)-2-C-methyl-D-erythritol kinase [Clostridia bacterium]|nr:4-(cytidine 5'-diphospho)-2-C-methyl-D-erythritol kinase [Clostridia bacterium]
MIITKKAYAKINLYLDVMGQRPDGYHDIKSVMQQVSLHDDVTVERDGLPGIRLLDMCDTLPCDENNIAYRCADVFLRHYDIREGVSIRITKRIPISAGLAGGSTDGAAVLLALAELFSDNIPTDLDTLCTLGSTIGADIPFCIVGGCALTLGIGDHITPLDYTPDCRILLAKSGSGISTPQAYRMLDEKYSDRLKEDFADFDGFLTSLHTDPVPVFLHNTFEDVILPIHDEAAMIRDILGENDGMPLMSGSGPSVFGLFTDDYKLQRACMELMKRHIEVYICDPVSRF